MIRHARLPAFLAALFLATTAVAAPQPAKAAAVLNVPGDFATIQAAINAASVGDTVLVAPGTYIERITIAKDITVESAAGPESTIIDGSLGGSTVTMTVPPTNSPELRGFTVQHGKGSLGGGIDLAGEGPALIEDNVITNNHSCDGAGITAYFSTATIRDNLFTDNSPSGCSGGSGGGAILILGAGSVQVIENVIVDNRNGNGGGISMNAAGTPTISGNVITGNNATTGGGIRMINDSEPFIVNNLIAGNGATTGGGIAWLTPSGSTGPIVTNNTIVGNTASAGPGIFADGFDAQAQVVNNLVVSATTQATIDCDAGSDGLPAQFAYNDIWNASGPESEDLCPGLVGTNSNISVDPLFVDATGDEYHLRPDSPVIDVGRAAGAPATDFDGDARPADGNADGTPAVDIGYDEAVDPLLVSPLHVDFGDVVETVAATPATVTLKNFGLVPLAITGISVEGANASDVSVSNETCTGESLGMSESCTITIAFTPGGWGSRSAHVVLDGPAPVGSRMIDVTGNGLDSIVVAPSSISAPDTAVGATATAGIVTLTNEGSQAVTVTGHSISGPNAADFSVTSQTCTAAPIAGGGSCMVTIRFKPTAVAPRSATLSIAGSAPIGTRTVSLAGVGIAPSSGVTWGSAATAGPSYTWNGGGALGRTLQSGTQRLHAAYATDRVGGKWAADSGPYAGVYYIRSTAGTTWSTPKRLNSSTQHAARLGLAAAGSRVYTIWVSQTKVINFSTTAPRALYVRVNTNHGSSTSWRSAVRLSSTTGRVDYPTIAATGDDAHIAWTDAATGSVRVTSSRDRGVTWKTTTDVGLSTLATSEGKSGFPSIAANGSTVALAWFADQQGTLKVRVSTNRGVSWGPTETVASYAMNSAAIAVRGNRIAVAWSTGEDVIVRQRTNGSWGSPQVIASLQAGGVTVPYAPSVVLQDNNRIGVAWSESLATPGHSQLRWSESSNGGTVWFQPQTLGAPSASSRRMNDWASVIWPIAGTRYVVWNAWTQNSLYYKLSFKKGTGSAAGPTFSPQALEPSSGIDAEVAPDDTRVLTRPSRGPSTR